ncbi:hypothetical protein F7Q92_04495 [Ideonella dechloratans]|uniref:Uncharacterized protein n=1 Tax=Ideonella dechloratans TaxID=36863 RepID=A0A643FF58_IDEDE|nr:hypothetical protein [Ideonella dechloratans]KAB0584211.1 hypothetical protein F7Q92_04495 [Ideonella dechloratans]UFU08559.1 hypothetical protein LRM40_09370 [Ideonella dechloratans]
MSSLAFADTLPSEAFEFDNDVSDSEFEPSDFGLPADRAARLAARRGFVEMKQVFLKAVAPIKGRKGDWLRQQVRQAHEPLDLWLLRGPVLSVLRHDDAGSRGLRADLYRSLDALIDQVRGRSTTSIRPGARQQAWTFQSSVDTALQAWR